MRNDECASTDCRDAWRTHVKVGKKRIDEPKPENLEPPRLSATRYFSGARAQLMAAEKQDLTDCHFYLLGSCTKVSLLAHRLSHRHDVGE